MPKKALYNSVGLLLSHGFSDFVAGVGEAVRDVAGDFDLEPGKWYWDGATHVAVPGLTADELAAKAVDSKDRLLFEINFDQENRVRALEGKAAITRAQYRDALSARWKALT